MQVFKELSEVSTIIAGQSPPSDTYNTDEVGLPFFQGKTDFGDLYPKIRMFCSIPQKIAEKNDILLSVRAPVGPTNLAPCKVCIGRGITAIRAGEKLNQKYLLLFFRSIEKLLSDSGTGTTFKAITQEQIRSIKIPFPPLPEQERIVARIEELFSELDKGIEALQTIKAQLKVYRQAVLKEAFEGKLTSEWRKKNNRSILHKFQSIEELSEDMPALPESWQYVCLSQLGDLARGKSKHRPRNDEILFKDGHYPFVQTGDIKAANTFLRTYSSMYNEVGLLQSKLWPIGTLCITIAANIAETAFLGIEACFPDSVVGFTANEKFVIKEYIEFFIRSAKLKLWAFAPATAQKNINLTTLENLYVPYCHIDEQMQIVMQIESRLSVCDKIEQTVDESLAKAESLRQSILKKAFEGRLI